MQILTHIQMRDGSSVIAVGAPDKLWNTLADGTLSVELLDGGAMCVPEDDIEQMFLHRRIRGSQYVAAVPS